MFPFHADHVWISAKYIHEFVFFSAGNFDYGNVANFDEAVKLKAMLLCKLRSIGFSVCFQAAQKGARNKLGNV
jgi:hypothetical protein